MGKAGKARRRAEGAQQQEAAKPKKKKLSYRDRAVESVRGMGKRLARLAKKLDKLPPELVLVVYETPDVDTCIEDSETEKVGTSVGAVAAAFDGFAKQVAALPDDWKPGRAKRGSSLVVEVGDVMQIREKSAAKYADLFPAETVFTVTDVKVALVGVKSSSGEVAYIPKGHLVRVVGI